MLAFYNKLMGTVVKPRVERRGWSVEARAWEGGDVCGEYLCPGGEVFEPEGLCICRVSWKKPTESKKSNKTNGYFPARGDSSRIASTNESTGKRHQPHSFSPPQGGLAQLDLCCAMIWWIRAEENWWIPSGVSQRLHFSVCNGCECQRVIDVVFVFSV